MTPPPRTSVRKRARPPRCRPPLQGDPSWPRIAGQKQPYLTEQLHAFKSGKRKSAIMAPLVANLSDEDIAALSKHFAGL